MILIHLNKFEGRDHRSEFRVTARKQVLGWSIFIGKCKYVTAGRQFTVAKNVAKVVGSTWSEGFRKLLVLLLLINIKFFLNFFSFEFFHVVF